MTFASVKLPLRELVLTHFILESPKWVKVKSANQLRCRIMWHLIRVSTILQVVQPFSNEIIFINITYIENGLFQYRGWSSGAMVLGKLPVPGRPTILITVGQGPIALAVDAGGGCLHIFTLIYPFSSLSPSLWETARYRLKYCLKGPLSPKQLANQPIFQYI